MLCCGSCGIGSAKAVAVTRLPGYKYHLLLIGHEKDEKDARERFRER